MKEEVAPINAQEALSKTREYKPDYSGEFYRIDCQIKQAVADGRYDVRIHHDWFGYSRRYRMAVHERYEGLGYGHFIDDQDSFYITWYIKKDRLIKRILRKIGVLK